MESKTPVLECLCIESVWPVCLWPPTPSLWRGTHLIVELFGFPHVCHFWFFLFLLVITAKYLFCLPVSFFFYNKGHVRGVHMDERCTSIRLDTESPDAARVPSSYNWTCRIKISFLINLSSTWIKVDLLSILNNFWNCHVLQYSAVYPKFGIVLSIIPFCWKMINKLLNRIKCSFLVQAFETPFVIPLERMFVVQLIPAVLIQYQLGNVETSDPPQGHFWLVSLRLRWVNQCLVYPAGRQTKMSCVWVCEVILISANPGCYLGM